MGKYSITGGIRLGGDVAVGGCKNAVLPILAATVLTGKRSIIHNCPNISDTHVSMEILRHLGCDVVYDGYSLVVDSGGASPRELPEKHVAKMRSSIIFAGSLLSRFGRIETTFPGGCELGARPLDLHLAAFERMGVVFDNSDECFIKGAANKLSGAKIELGMASVGATQNIMLAAVLADGDTIIKNAAREPEIIDLQNFLNMAGAKVYGAGTAEIFIQGVKTLRSVEYEIMPDRIVAGTYLAAGAITRGHISLKNVRFDDMTNVVARLVAMGASVREDGKDITLKMKSRPIALAHLCTGPHPAFPTDMQPQFAALLATARGRSVVTENMFEARDAHIDELLKMGCNIKKFNSQRFFIEGVGRLRAAEVAAKDLRGGAALVLAGLIAEGETVVDNIHYIERGYEDIQRDLQALGARIALTTAE
ncbi:MAG: UDP-N-acetylglucosamine 1-carboxyvinyltransferase [Defluviitaleaceae bacterium]|nr:UDP-N-acetylglucosamine 1-carboxyvinyltransferase [Defluviitaleaceae bacterium]